MQTATAHEAPTVSRVRSIPGVGQILARVRRYDIHAIRRCPRVQAFVSYGGPVTGAKESAGKRSRILTFYSILKFFQVDKAGMFRMTSSARYFK